MRNEWHSLIARGSQTRCGSLRRVVELGAVLILLAVSASVRVPPGDAQTPSPLTVQPTTNRVGINQPNPGYALDVNGTVNATAFQGDASQLTNLPASNGSPAGCVIAFAGSTPPAGWLEANGSPVSRTTYAQLFAVIGTTYGTGDGTSTFNLPDYRGQFLRGWAHGTSADPDRTTRTNRGDGMTGDIVGTKQGSQFGSHTHALNPQTGYRSIFTGSPWDAPTYGPAWDPAYGVTSAVGGTETRPININVMYIIKY